MFRLSWNESEAQFRLGLLSTAAASSRAERGRYPAAARDLEDGSPLGFDPEADHSGYAFRYHVDPRGSRCAWTARPLEAGETGVRSFCADSRGRWLESAQGEPPAAVDGLCDRRARAVVEQAFAREPGPG